MNEVQFQRDLYLALCGHLIQKHYREGLKITHDDFDGIVNTPLTITVINDEGHVEFSAHSALAENLIN